MNLKVRDRIIKGCSELFYHYGINSVSVDDISAHLGISKKTFYEYFINKNAIINEIANEFISRNRLANKEIIEEKTDVFDKLMRIYNKMLLQFRTCNPRFLFDIKKHHPEVYELLSEFREKELHYMITNLIKQGKDQGLIRKEINEHAIFELHLNRITNILEGKLLPENTLSDQIFLEFIKISIIGITTLKGHEIVEERFNRIKNE